jgi:phosphopentomutase
MPGAGTNHGTPYGYDSHVPLIFYGWKVKPGFYTIRTGISDVAPTLAFILNVETPSGSVGHILSPIIGK